jgi:UDP-sugar transporter A1/2/3
MKQEYQTSIHVQNAWIYAFGVFFNGISLALYSWRGGEWHGLLHGYTGLTWTVVLLNTVLGLTIALILKHVDNIFHLFAHQVTAVSVLVCSIVLFDFQLSIAFLCGATIVACSIYTFTLAKHMAFQQAE